MSLKAMEAGCPFEATARSESPNLGELRRKWAVESAMSTGLTDQNAILALASALLAFVDGAPAPPSDRIAELERKNAALSSAVDLYQQEVDDLRELLGRERSYNVRCSHPMYLLVDNGNYQKIVCGLSGDARRRVEVALGLCK